MRKLLILNITALAMTALLAVLIVQTTSSASDSLKTMRTSPTRSTKRTRFAKRCSSWATRCAATCSIRRSSASGTPRWRPTVRWPRRSQAVGATTDRRRREMAEAIGKLDEEQLNPAENRVLDAAKSRSAEGDEDLLRRVLPDSPEADGPDRCAAEGSAAGDGPARGEEIASLESVKRRGVLVRRRRPVLCVVAGVWAWRTTASVTRQIEASVEALTPG